IRVKYLDETFTEHEEEFSGIRARVFQHEYDHLEGKVFTDRLSPLRRTLLKRKLGDVAAGKVVPSYRMKRPQTKKR
ncbi:MAG: peptide deformylase, partial [Bacteroidales bacterium]|nr:peptide deformylase [Bacteroidales bacterium]